jgi:hypothetical protein
MRVAALGVSSVLFGAVACLACPADAQTFAFPGGEPSSAPGFVFSTPLRLTLEGSVVPWARGFPQCETREDDVGNSVRGIPVQHYAALRFLPQLVLSGFSQLGCPIDGGLGAALTHATPLGGSAWFVMGVGAYTTTARTPFSSPDQVLRVGPTTVPAMVSAHADLVVQAPSGAPLSLGAAVIGRRPTLTFGGGF